MLVNSGKPTTASYMSNTNPIPFEKTNVAACTAMAGEFLGMKLIYMDGGSGAEAPISTKMINTVSKTIDIPLIIGGGITNAKKALENCQAGADIIVVGNAIEKDNSIIKDISEAIHSI
jgi:putative glycerol-1-phosphate prenyltransferase